MAENKTLCIACKYKFHDRDLQPCADCLRSTQLAQQGIDPKDQEALSQLLAIKADAKKTAKSLSLKIPVLRLMRTACLISRSRDCMNINGSS